MSDLPIELQAEISDNVSRALAEDIGSGDLSAQLVPPDQQVAARVLSRDEAVICGQPWFDEVFHQLSEAINVTWLVTEGRLTQSDSYICELSGPARTLLTGERTALNFLQTLSATATSAHEYSAAVAGTAATILDTRKTLPGLRQAQKYAVRVGGASNHRLGLHDAIMIKENHIMACAGIEAAVSTARSRSNDVSIIVEVETLDEAKTAMQTEADRLLLDDFSLEDMRAAVELRNNLAPGTKLEVSGGVTIKNVRKIAEVGVDFISVGSLTKHIKAADLSMRFKF